MIRCIQGKSDIVPALSLCQPDRLSQSHIGLLALVSQRKGISDDEGGNIDIVAIHQGDDTRVDRCLCGVCAVVRPLAVRPLLTRDLDPGVDTEDTLESLIYADMLHFTVSLGAQTPTRIKLTWRVVLATKLSSMKTLMGPGSISCSLVFVMRA